MSTKRILLVGLLFVLMLFIVGCSPAEVSEEQIQNDVTSSAPEWDTDAVIDSFTIVRRIPNEEEKTEKVHVKIDGKTDLLYSLRYYTLSYFYSKDEGWMLSDIEAENEDLWETKPLAGPGTSLIKQALLNKVISVNNDEWEFTDETIKSIRIDKNEPDFENNMSDVYCTVFLENDFVSVVGGACVACAFDPESVTNPKKEALTQGGWYVLSTLVSSDFSCQFKDGRKPTVLTEEIVTKILSSELFRLNDYNSDYQFIRINSENISDLTFEQPIPSKKGERALYKGTFSYKDPIATFFVEYTATCIYYNDSGWEYSGISFDSECTAINNIPKNWTGIYDNGDMGVDLTFTSIKSNGNLEATFSFYPMPGNVSGKSGSFKMKGTYDPKTLKIKLKGYEWIERPSWYYFIDIDGSIRIDSKSIVSNDDELVVYVDSEMARLKKTPSICDETQWLSDVEVKEINKAIEVIYKKYNVGVVFLLTNTSKDLWDYLCEHDERFNNYLGYGDRALLGINICGSGEVDYKNGYAGDKLEDFSTDYILRSYIGDRMYGHAFKEYLLSLNEYLGGSDSDLTFSW